MDYDHLENWYVGYLEFIEKPLMLAGMKVEVVEFGTLTYGANEWMYVDYDILSVTDVFQMHGADYITERNNAIVTVEYNGLSSMVNEFYDDHERIMESILFSTG